MSLSSESMQCTTDESYFSTTAGKWRVESGEGNRMGSVLVVLLVATNWPKQEQKYLRALI